MNKIFLPLFPNDCATLSECPCAASVSVGSSCHSSGNITRQYNQRIQISYLLSLMPDNTLKEYGLQTPNIQPT